MPTFRSALIAGTAAALVLSAPACAQDATGAPAAAAQTGTAADDIVVTAQKREQRLIDVPQSVSVIGSDLLRQTHADRLDDYLSRVPSAAINEAQAGQARIILRGINTGSDAATVATYIDETPYGSATSLANGGTLAPDFDPSEVQRIEVLRGPQGTLYGANSLGGLVKFVTVAPSTDAVHVFGQAGFEDIDHGGVGYSFRGALNLPISSDLAVRGSGFYRKDSGYIDDPNQGKDVNEVRSYGGRASILYHPDEALTLRATALIQNLASDAPNAYDADPITLSPTLGRYTQSHIVAEPSDVKYRVYNGTGSYDFGPVTFLSSTSQGNLRQALVQDATALFGAPSDVNEDVIQHRFTEEARLASSRPGFFEWTLGGFYTRERNAIRQNLGLNDATTGAITMPGLETVNFRSRYREIAGFASGTFHFTPKLDLTLGGRYSHNKQDSTETIGGALVPPPGLLFTGNSSDNVFTYSVAPSFKPNDHLTFYARVARGYRPGGPNVLPAIAVPGDVPRSFSPDRTTNYEVGVKSELLDRKLSLELTGFWIDWSRIQLLASVDGFGVNINGGDARSRGIEAAATLKPTSGLTLSANGAYIDAYLRNDVTGFGAESGDHLPYTARFSGTVSAEYERPLTDRINGEGGVSWRYTGHRESAFQLPPLGQHRLGGFSQVDAHAGVTFGHFRLDAFVRNLTDSHGITDVAGAGSAENGAVSVAIIRPRSFGATFGFNY